MGKKARTTLYLDSEVVIEAQELKHILEALNESDELTYELLGHGWNGRRPYWKLHDFM